MYSQSKQKHHPVYIFCTMFYDLPYLIKNITLQ